MIAHARVGFFGGAHEIDTVATPDELANQDIEPLGRRVSERVRARGHDQDNRHGGIVFEWITMTMKFRFLTYGSARWLERAGYGSCDRAPSNGHSV